MHNWYLLYCKRNEMQRAEVHLKRQGVDCYYPQVTVEKLKRGKPSSTLEPLFPNYLFISFDPEQISYTTIRSTRGVMQFVRNGSVPSVVDIEIVKSLMINEDSDESRAYFMQRFVEGDRVTLSNGPYSGIKAIFKEKDGDNRSILLLSMLNKKVTLSVENKEIIAI
ncbi:transcription/translation regulatory transformer protein RfaH [Veronia pacifica]|uniref:Transcription antitermination protein RfaH n=1 Tax=Veronia pacifica TaxID=1080227 RepID=A0A1C3ERU0_9GAMM|nr:transcription/translation regulatory transformer protein RfaH [Veronia pacifica]ODA35969.1 transcriptional activator RfaH [Veronia pacifica]